MKGQIPTINIQITNKSQISIINLSNRYFSLKFDSFEKLVFVWYLFFGHL